jgi:multidrug resistance protein, MATE family
VAGREPLASPPDNRSIPRRLAILAGPIIGVNVLNVLALAVDTAMVGRTDMADTALTGLGFATQVIFLLMVAMLGLTVGTVAFVARAHGAGHDERVDHILAQSSQLTTMMGLTVAIVGNLAAPWILSILGASDAALDAGLLYLRPLLACSTFYYLNILYAAVLRGVGNTRLAFGVALVMNLLNVVFNYGLILGNYGLPAMGIAGAAWGTAIAQMCSVALYVVLLKRGVSGITLSLRPRPIDIPLAKDLIRVGSPAAMDMLVLNAGFLSIVGMLGRFDEVAVAAHGIGLRIQALAFVPGMSISQATGAMVGNALGAKNIEQARAIARASMAMCFTVMVTLCLVIVAVSVPTVQLFDVDPASPLGGYTITWIKLLAACMPPVGIYIALVGVFQGSGATRLSLRINILATLAQIPISWVLGFPLGLGAWGIWAGFPVAFVIKAIMGSIEYRRASWAKIGARA